MLILHGSLHILVAHRSHHGSQVSGLLQNPGTVIVSPAIQDKIFRKPSLGPGFTESCCHCCEVGRLGALRWEDPSFAPCAAPLFKNFIDAIAHRHASPSLFGLAVWHEDDPPVPIQVLNAHPVKLSLISHARIARQYDDVPEKLKAELWPVAGSSASQQFLFRFIIKPK